MTSNKKKIDSLNAEETAIDERLKRNVQIMKRALRSSALEKKIHREVLKRICKKRERVIIIIGFFCCVGYRRKKCKEVKEMV